MIQEADTLGTFHIESSAQMSMLPQMNPLRFYDLVIQGAIVRPGPIQGAMVHQYLRRREGLEKPEYPRPELRAAGEDAGRVAVPGTGDESGEQRVEDMVGRGYSDES
jgi:error-prone DNA polymerase